MDISTSTNICAFTRSNKRLPPEFSIETCAKAGYQVLDMNFCIAMNPYSPMKEDGFMDYINDIKHLSERLGIRFNQSHLPYYDIGNEADPKRIALMEKLIRRSIIGSDALGAKWMVAHPFTVKRDIYDPDEQLDFNVEYFKELLTDVGKYSAGLALENDFFLADEPHAFASDIRELIELVDRLQNYGKVGVCYDFGHANLMKYDHRAALNLIGKRLKAVHVQDNHGLYDEHLLPYYGTIDWNNAMGGLADIAYDGDLTFEVQEQGRYLPDDLKYLIVEQSLIIGRKLVSCFWEASGAVT